PTNTATHALKAHQMLGPAGPHTRATTHATAASATTTRVVPIDRERASAARRSRVRDSFPLRWVARGSSIALREAPSGGAPAARAGALLRRCGRVRRALTCRRDREREPHHRQAHTAFGTFHAFYQGSPRARP